MITQPDPARLQSRSVDLPGRRRLLHRHLDLRMVSRRPDPPFDRPGELAAGEAAARPRQPARHARQSRFRRRLGALPVPCRRQVLAGLYRRQAARRQFQGQRTTTSSRRPRSRGRGPIRSMSTHRASTRRCSTTTTAEKWFLNMLWNHVSHGVGGSRNTLPSPAYCCRNTIPVAARLVGPVKNIFAGSDAWAGRRPASLQARRLVLSDHRRGRHRLRPCRHHGALDARSTGRTSCIPTCI